jgi:hypothetical protein
MQGALLRGHVSKSRRELLSLLKNGVDAFSGCLSGVQGSCQFRPCCLQLLCHFRQATSQGSTLSSGCRFVVPRLTEGVSERLHVALSHSPLLEEVSLVSGQHVQLLPMHTSAISAPGWLWRSSRRGRLLSQLLYCRGQLGP